MAWQEQVSFQWDDDDDVPFVIDQHAKFDFTVQAYWNNSPRIDMSPHSDTLAWLRANQS